MRNSKHYVHEYLFVMISDFYNRLVSNESNVCIVHK